VCTAADTGDTGSASALIALTRALELADPGDRIVVVGYGAGAGADAVALTARRRPGHTGLGAALAAGRRVSYAEAVRAERRYAGHERLVGTFE
jgi:hydroxymethylglutaryl-CoA synthase